MAVEQTPFEQVFGPMSTFVRQPAPAAVSLLGTIVAFVCLLWSVVNSFWHSPDEDWRPKVLAFVKAFVVVALIAYSGGLINAVRQAVDQAYDAAGAPGAGIRQVLDDIRDNNAAAEQYKQPKTFAPMDLWGQMKESFNSLCYALGRGLTMAIWVVVWVVRLLQDVFVVMLYVLLPLAFGLAVTPWFSSVGTGLISSLVGVLFWPMGFLLVDAFVLAVLKATLQALNNYAHQVAAGEGGLSGIFWFLGAVNDIGFGVDLLLIGIVMLCVTAAGYYASTKFITSLFGAAGGAITSGISALGKAPGLAAGAATIAAGAATVAAGGALAGLGALGPTGSPAAPLDGGQGLGPSGDARLAGPSGRASGAGAQNAIASSSGGNASDAGAGVSAEAPGEGVGADGGVPAPPRRSLAGLQAAGQTLQRAGVFMMVGGASRTMRQTMKHSAAHALVDASRGTSARRRSLEALEDNDG